MSLPEAIPFLDNAPASESFALLTSLGIDPSTLLGTAVNPDHIPTAPIPKAQGILLRAVHDHVFRELLITSTDTSNIRLRSCSGAGNGDWLRDTVDHPPAQLNDAEFMTALRWRLGLPIAPSSSHCQHHAAKDHKKLCLQPLDVWCEHAVTCNTGGAPTNVLHHPLAILLATLVSDSGLQARREVPIAEFTRIVATTAGPETRDGIVDVLGWSSLWGEFLLDVTVRHPGAARYYPDSCHTTGHANSTAERDKAITYAASAGRVVTPCSIETYGRFGNLFEDFLQKLASCARQRDRSRGISSVRYLSKWRLQVGTALMKGIAKTIHDALTPSRLSHPAACN